jgi:3-methyl-2-oxobutanoate hydroxymethyltransferase
MHLARQITEAISIPTIGIGAGPYCDGQILVLHDVIGLFERFVPKFIKKYANVKEDALKAIREYKNDVENGSFPSEEQSFK